ncbi:GyrI-like domain-containing protein [Iodobacter sp.]|uniref:GyrI-like domain-containing protein n=1 Tax=Iodobacter sp. TaxID=1915058 RepID=UPI0025D2FA6E|nr:GyrI-like domain-containing protein [Iodobacter sp.]
MIEQKLVPAQQCLSIKKHLSLPELKEFAQVISSLCEETATLGLEITGPLEFIYFGVDGNPKTKFDLIIAVPVNKIGEPSSQFEYYESEPFNCSDTNYQGGMSGMPKAWGGFVESIFNLGLIPTIQCREVYKHWVDDESNENITELQMGIESKA